MSTESINPSEVQNPEKVRSLRQKLRDLYFLPEVSEAVIEHYMGRATDYGLERFANIGAVEIKKGLFVFHFFPLVRRDRDNKYPELAVERTPLLINETMLGPKWLEKYGTPNPNSYTLFGNLRVIATDPEKIEVGFYKKTPLDWEYRRIRGEEALSITEEVIESFIYPENQRPQSIYDEV
jgi:hypothetical protein